MTWHCVTLAAFVILLAALIRQSRLRAIDQQRMKQLTYLLDAGYANYTRLCREKAELELQLRTARHAYIFDLPVHIPGSLFRCPN